MQSWHERERDYDLPGNAMASGLPFDGSAMTAAMLHHVPLGTKVTVTLASNPASAIVVTITDRGPYGHADRIIDLTKAAFIKLVGSLSAGTVRVTVRVP